MGFMKIWNIMILVFLNIMESVGEGLIKVGEYVKRFEKDR